MNSIQIFEPAGSGAPLRASSVKNAGKESNGQSFAAGFEKKAAEGDEATDQGGPAAPLELAQDLPKTASSGSTRPDGSLRFLGGQGSPGVTLSAFSGMENSGLPQTSTGGIDTASQSGVGAEAGQVGDGKSLFPGRPTAGLEHGTPASLQTLEGGPMTGVGLPGSDQAANARSGQQVVALPPAPIASSGTLAIPQGTLEETASRAALHDAHGSAATQAGTSARATSAPPSFPGFAGVAGATSLQAIASSQHAAAFATTQDGRSQMIAASFEGAAPGETAQAGSRAPGPPLATAGLSTPAVAALAGQTSAPLQAFVPQDGEPAEGETDSVDSSDKPLFGIGPGVSDAGSTLLPARGPAGLPQDVLSRQIAPALQDLLNTGRGATTELRLDPEELGRIRMSLSSIDGQLTVALSADRPETLDLMRRYMDELRQDLRGLGFAQVSFQMNAHAGQGGRGEPAATLPTAETGSDTETPTLGISPVASTLASVAGAGGLDLRL